MDTGRTRVAGRLLLLLLLLLPAVAGCGARELKNPVRLTLTNRSGGVVTGAVLRFDRELARVDRVSGDGFADTRLRTSPANTLRLEGGVVGPSQAVVYELTGRDGPPVLEEGRWLVRGTVGPRITDEEVRVR